MKRRILTCLSALTLVASSTALLPGPSHAADAQEVSCSAIELKYDGPATMTKCLQLDQFGNQTEVKIQRLIAETSSSQLIITYYAAKFRTYFPIRPLRQVINDAHYFSGTDNWQAEQKYAGFDIAAFDGLGKAGDPPTLCAGFVRYSGQPGNYEFDNGPGYRNVAQGLYCVFSGQAALINPPDNFYRLVEDVIGKLHLPQ